MSTVVLRTVHVILGHEPSEVAAVRHEALVDQRERDGGGPR